ncbi:MAG: Gfo/Idh/MocA family oxidoreductase [bacterium]|jgi:predicted dehydrogenase|nr:Gfo/Idh/MocA family oxidoreductase [bacterium]
MVDSTKVKRRGFMGASAAAAALTVLPRQVLGGASFVAPNDKINIGFIGAGTQGIRQLIEALPMADVHIGAICDPNEESSNYVDWYRNEIRDKIRAFLDQPTWGVDASGCRCGRKIGLEIVKAYYGKTKPSGEYAGCPGYSDFREMLTKEDGLDAVYIMTPEHLHATIAITAMNMGKHVITHKPIANVFQELDVTVQTAAKSGVATHLFCAAGSPSTSDLCEWIWNGAIGPVREVHNWSTRPLWPQGMTQWPEEQPVPAGLDWDLWLGPVPHRPYSSAYEPVVFRGWYEFGSGALGDMGHYSFYQIFKILKLGMPTTVEATRSQYWEIVDYLWQKQINDKSFPRASMIHWEFPEREGMPPVSLHWYDGGLRPPLLRELEEDGQPMPEEGMLFVGENGKILAGFTGGEPRLIPDKRMKMFRAPEKTLPRPLGEMEQWIQACKGGEESGAAFGKVYPFSVAIALGNVALRVDKKLHWDAEKKSFLNSEDANALLRRSAYREGWEL